MECRSRTVWLNLIKVRFLLRGHWGLSLDCIENLPGKRSTLMSSYLHFAFLKNYFMMHQFVRRTSILAHLSWRLKFLKVASIWHSFFSLGYILNDFSKYSGQDSNGSFPIKTSCLFEIFADSISGNLKAAYSALQDFYWRSWISSYLEYFKLCSHLKSH